MQVTVIEAEDLDKIDEYEILEVFRSHINIADEDDPLRGSVIQEFIQVGHWHRLDSFEKLVNKLDSFDVGEDNTNVLIKLTMIDSDRHISVNQTRAAINMMQSINRHIGRLERRKKNLWVRID